MYYAQYYVGRLFYHIYNGYILSSEAYARYIVCHTTGCLYLE
jgi:hypothetical protein